MHLFTKNNCGALLFIILATASSINRGGRVLAVPLSVFGQDADESTTLEATTTENPTTTDEPVTTASTTESTSEDEDSTTVTSDSTVEPVTTASTTDSTSETSVEDSTTVTSDSTEQTTAQLDKELLIHFIGDLHYNILPVDSNMDLCQVTSGIISEGCLGGYGRLATYMSEKKADTDIWLNAGNMLQGSLFRILKFDPIVEAMNDLQFDFVAAESEMFRYGIEAAEQIYMEGLGDMLVSFNYKGESTKQIQKGGCKIAIVGFVDKEKTDAMGVTDLTLQDEMEYITNEVGELKAGDSDIIIVMGSTSKDKALEIASIEGVNLVIYSEAEASDLSPGINYFWNDTQSGETVYIATLKINDTNLESLFMVGEISLTITEDCKVSDAAFNVSDYGERNISDSLLDKTLTLLEDMQKIVVKTSVPLTGANNVCQLGECLLGNLVADAVMSAVSAVGVSLAEPPVKFSVLPMWTLLTNVSLQGEVNMADLYGIFEDDSYIYSVVLSGKQLKDIFEEAVSDYQSPTVSMENFLQVSNYLRATYNMKKKSGERVNKIQIFDISDPSESDTVDFNDARSIYNIALPKFVLEGDHFSFIKTESLTYKFYKFTFLDTLKDYISWKGTLQNSPIPVIPTVGERIKFYEETSTSEETCYNNTGEVVIVTLVIVAVLAGAGFAGYKFLYPKFMARRGSRTALIM